MHSLLQVPHILLLSYPLLILSYGWPSTSTIWKGDNSCPKCKTAPDFRVYRLGFWLLVFCPKIVAWYIRLSLELWKLLQRPCYYAQLTLDYVFLQLSLQRPIESAKSYGSIPRSIRQVQDAKDKHAKSAPDPIEDRKSTRLNSSHPSRSRMPSSAWKKKH